MNFYLQGGWRFEGPCYPTISELVRHQWQSGEPVTNKSQTILANPIVRESWELNNDDVVLETKIGNVRSDCFYATISITFTSSGRLESCRCSFSCDINLCLLTP